MKDSTDWLEKWKTGETRFHQQSIHPHLLKHGSLLSEGAVFVPLCGKSLDMLHLLKLGHSVVGVELSPIACRDFFLENKISYEEKRVGDFTVYASEKVTLWCGDYFKLPDSVWQSFQAIYDRAALVALPQEIRNKYVSEIKSRAGEGCSILLITFEYGEGKLKGPPFSVSDQEVREQFAGLKIDLLERANELVRDVPVSENCYLITR